MAKESGYYYIDINGKIVNSKAYMEEGTPFSKDGVAYAKGIPARGMQYGTEGFINKKGKLIKEKNVVRLILMVLLHSRFLLRKMAS